MDSLYSALKSIYPNYEWIPWKFQRIPKNYWLNIENQRKYFNWLSNKLNIKSNEDWYNVKLSDIENNGGSSLLKNYYENSLFKSLKSIYPNIKFDQWKFKYLNIYAEEEENLKQNLSQQQWKSIVDSLSLKLKIKDLDDWYRIGKQQLSNLKLLLFVKKHGGKNININIYYFFKLFHFFNN